MKTHNYFSKLLLFSLTVSFCFSCSKDPIVADSAEIDQTSLIDLIGVRDGIYSTMADHRYMGRDYMLLMEVRSDNVFSNGRTNRYARASRMSIGPVDQDTDNSLPEVYRYIYNAIAKANIIIKTNFEEVIINDDLENLNLNHIIGEAYVTRAMGHFDLLRLFGQQYINEGNDLGVVYVKEYNPDDRNKLNQARGSVSENKVDLYADIEKGIEFLKLAIGSEFDNDRGIITLDAAYALKSSVGVYFGYKNPEDYDKALEGAEQIIDKYTLLPADQYVDYWSSLSIGEESIFELERSPSENNGGESANNIYRGGTYGDVETFRNIFDDAEFDDNDVRSSQEMIDYEGSKLVNKGKWPHMGGDMGIDNFKKIRYAEVVLNYAEALMHNDANKALSYLNKLAVARDAKPYTEINIENILKERRKEFIYEGLRLPDLARTGKGISAMDTSMPNNHGDIPPGDYRFALPIPQHEVDSNTEMIQNPGY